MKINKPSLSKKSLIITISVVLVAVLGYGAYAMTNKQWPFATETSRSETTSSSTDTSNANTPATPSDADSSSDTPTKSPKTPVENEPSDTIPEDQVSVILTSINTRDNIVKVKSLIETITNEGTCTLTFTMGSKKVTKTSGVQALPSSSTCSGFDVPVSELAAGTWHVKLSVTTNGKTGSASQDYKVQ